MNPEQPSLLHLKQTSVRSPQLQQSPSTQSIAASEHFFSFSDPASSESDDNSNITAFRFATPRSREQSPPLSNAHMRPEQSASPSVKSARLSVASRPPARVPGTVSFDESTIMQRSRPASSVNLVDRRSAADPLSPSTTPGVDDTPYIRFAIDQLTRDEEVRGSRRYPGKLEDVSEVSEESYPVDRIIPDEGLGYTSQQPSSQHTRNSRQSQQLQQFRRSQHYQPPQQPQQPPQRQEEIQQVQQPQQAPMVMPHGPFGFPVQAEEPEVPRDIFVPHYPSHDSLLHAPLDFVPAILRPFSLLTFLLACLLMLAGLVFCAVYSRIHHGLRKYHEFGGPIYFIFQYMPPLLGMLVLMWLFQVDTALRRIVPFISLANKTGRSQQRAIFLDLYPKSFFLPQFQYFTSGHPLLGLCSLIFWASLFTIPLLSSCFNVRYHGTFRLGEWRWVAVQGVIWTAIGLYTLLAFAIIFIIASISRTSTGLRWDPRSLADIICLVERSNIVNDYAGSETFASRKDFREKLSDRSDRLGYWHTSKRPSDIFYSLGQPGVNTRRYSIEEGRIKEKTPEKGHPDEDDDTNHTIQRPQMPHRYTTDFSIRMDIRSSRVRLRYLPWYLRDGAAVAWVVIAVVLLLAFLIISFLNDAIRDGFQPGASAATHRNGYSSSNFLYSFVPSLIGLVLFLFWQSLDLTFRGLQPYASLSSQNGATAEQSLLIDYTARLPGSVTVIAASNRHYRVAVLSFMTLVNIAIPVIAGGVFWTQFYAKTHSIRVAAHLPGYFALCCFLALYALAILIILPGRRRAALPHAPWNLAEMISYLYQSPILTDRAFARPPTKAELVTRLMGAGWTDRSTFSRSVINLVNPSKRNLGDTAGRTSPDKGKDRDMDEKRYSTTDPGSIRYGFGVHVGRDGKEHLGIDRVRRSIGREMVIHEAQRRSWISRV